MYEQNRREYSQNFPPFYSIYFAVFIFPLMYYICGNRITHNGAYSFLVLGAYTYVPKCQNVSYILYFVQQIELHIGQMQMNW